MVVNIYQTTPDNKINQRFQNLSIVTENLATS